MSRNAENQVKIAEAGGIEAILEGMGRHKEHADVKELGCVGLWNLSGNAENQVKIAEAGGIEAIVEGMGRHKEHAGVQEQGCGALANLGMVKQENDIKIRIVRSSYDGFVLKKIFCPLL